MLYEHIREDKLPRVATPLELAF